MLSLIFQLLYFQVHQKKEENNTGQCVTENFAASLSTTSPPPSPVILACLKIAQVHPHPKKVFFIFFDRLWGQETAHLNIS